MLALTAQHPRWPCGWASKQHVCMCGLYNDLLTLPSLLGLWAALCFSRPPRLPLLVEPCEGAREGKVLENMDGRQEGQLWKEPGPLCWSE